MINAAKNKCSDVSIFKGKARNVDYMSSCKLRVFEKFSLYKYVWTGEAMAADMPCTILDFRDRNSVNSHFFFQPLPLQSSNLAQTVALHFSFHFLCKHKL